MASTPSTPPPLSRLIGTPPAGLDALDAADLYELSTAIAAVRTQQKQALTQAMQAALNHIPALLRAPIRAVLLPSCRT